MAISASYCYVTNFLKALRSLKATIYFHWPIYWSPRVWLIEAGVSRALQLCDSLGTSAPHAPQAPWVSRLAGAGSSCGDGRGSRVWAETCEEGLGLNLVCHHFCPPAIGQSNSHGGAQVTGPSPNHMAMVWMQGGVKNWVGERGTHLPQCNKTVKSFVC